MNGSNNLSVYAKSEPQAAHTGFFSGFKNKVTYFRRSIPKISELLNPLDTFIDNHLIPVLTVGHCCTHDFWVLVSLPVRHGGLEVPVDR